MFIALLIGYGVISVLVTAVVAAFLGRTRERVAVSLTVVEAQQEYTTNYEDYGQKAA